MQVMFYRGDVARFYGEGIFLAKSSLDLRDRVACEAARRAADYPRGYRHELLSVAMLDKAPELVGHAHDAELVRYLVGTHHGRARPIPPMTPRENTTEALIPIDGIIETVSTNHSLERLDSGWIDLFWTLNGRYGPWGLAFLEAILRLADHNESREEQEKPAEASTSGKEQ
jgi:CRISPR-associated endonuclease/helicase Cas3